MPLNDSTTDEVYREERAKQGEKRGLGEAKDERRDEGVEGPRKEGGRSADMQKTGDGGGGEQNGTATG